jgi:alpha-1,3/alpha-1,6-mannosyltransferase
MAYRYPFDWFEGWSMSASDRIVVNSNFTRSVASRVFPSIGHLGVIYPCVDVDAKGTEEKTKEPESPLWPNTKFILSINRFERKKDIGLAIRAFHALPNTLRKTTRLVLAGGYDARVSENVQYHKELVSLAESLHLTTATAKTVPTALAVPSTIEVLFLLSIPGAFKSTLLRNASLLVYTPTNEHFGIVPVEAMHEGVPVLAANTGGPLETVGEGQTGWLRDVGKIEEWTAVMRQVLGGLSEEALAKMGRRGKERVKTEFSRTTMAAHFESEMVEMLASPRPEFIEWRDIMLALGVCGVFVAAFVLVVLKAMFRQATPLPPRRQYAADRKGEL